MKLLRMVESLRVKGLLLLQLTPVCEGVDDESSSPLALLRTGGELASWKGRARTEAANELVALGIDVRWCSGDVDRLGAALERCVLALDRGIGGVLSV